MAFGIPNNDQISALIKQAMDEATAAGVALETQEQQILHDQMHASITEMLSGIAPVVDCLTRIVNLLERLDGATVTLNLKPQEKS
jgi:hypothetical protein